MRRIQARMLWTLLLAGGTGVTACERRARETADAKPTAMGTDSAYTIEATSGEPGPFVPIGVRPTSPAVRLTLEAPDTVQLGEPVRFRAVLTNPTDSVAWVRHMGRSIPLNFVVRQPDGTTVWISLEGASIDAIDFATPLEPHEVREFTATWDQRDSGNPFTGDTRDPVPPGEYRVYAHVETRGIRTPEQPLIILP